MLTPGLIFTSLIMNSTKTASVIKYQILLFKNMEYQLRQIHKKKWETINIDKGKECVRRIGILAQYTSTTNPVASRPASLGEWLTDAPPLARH